MAFPLSLSRALGAAAAGFLVGLVAATGSVRAGDDAAKPDDEPIKTGLVERVEVSATVAKDREDPASFSDLDRDAIAGRHQGQDLGMLLADTPNAYAYSDAGNGVGYSYLSLRGFDQRRIAVNINGVPLNTPEGREVYYIDLADFAASLDLIQVQRGPGTSLYGAPAVGGVVNLETGHLSTKPGGRLTVGAGSFGTYRTSFEYGGSLAGGRWAWSARLGHVRSDGYREPSWTRHTLGQIAFERFSDESIWKILLFGGPERTQLAYYGLPVEYLRGEISGDADRDRRVNFLRPGETDTFVQPQLQVMNDRRLGDGLFLRNTWYAIVGRGYFRQYGDTYAYDPKGFEPATAEFPERTISAAWRKRGVYNRQVGWLPRMTWDHAGGTLTAGAELLAHEGRHRGYIVDGAYCTASGVDPCSTTAPLGGNPLLYSYDRTKRTITLYARETLQPGPRVRVDLEAQATRHRFAMSHDRVRGYAWDATYNFLTPRAGVNWNVTDRWNLYAQASTARSEPYFDNIWDPQETDQDPRGLFAGYEPASKTLSRPDARPERLRSFEGGARYRNGVSRLKVNAYRMEFRDEFVFAGGIDDNGVPKTTNAGRSVHQGVEIDAATRLPGELDLSGYIAASRDVLKRYTLLSPQPDGSVATVDWSGNRVALFPDSLVRVRFARAFGPVRVEAGARRVGTIYTDNSQDERKTPDVRLEPGYVAKKVPSHTVADLAVTADLGRAFGARARGLVARVWVDNILDRRYETMGYSYPNDETYRSFYTEFFPAATRSVFAALTYEF